MIGEPHRTFEPVKSFGQLDQRRICQDVAAEQWLQDVVEHGCREARLLGVAGRAHRRDMQLHRHQHSGLRTDGA